MARNKEKELLIKLYKKSNLIAASLFVILLFTGSTFLLYPYYNGLKLEFTEAQRQYESRTILENQRLRMMSKLMDDFHSIDPESLAKIYSLIPARSDEIEILPEIEHIFGPFGLITSIVTTDISSQPEPGLGTIKTEMNVAGIDYDTAKRLLYVLETSLRLIDVKTISYSNDNLTLTFNAYFWKGD